MRLFEPSEVPDKEKSSAASPEGSAVGAGAPGAVAAAGSLRRVMLLIAYDGTSFHGFAPQPGRRTVGGVLSETLGIMTGAPVNLTCAGRTDTGVHAAGQVVHADLDEAFGEGFVARLPRSLSRQLGTAIGVLDADVAAEGFDARFSALARRYRYDILTGRAPDPLLRGRVWHVESPLELAAMRMTADALIGSHDFSAFCRAPDDPEASLVRSVTDTRLEQGLGEGGRILRFEIEANAFCHRMVRSIVGALVAVGIGKMTCADVVGLLRSAERGGGGRAGTTAPAEGLTLELVRYPPDLLPGRPADGVWRARL